MGMSVAENILLADSSAASVGPFAVPRRRAALVKEWIDRLRIRTPDSGTDVASLSGGNQQKVVLAKWMSSPRLRVLVLDHPTRGLDVGAKEDVYRFVREMCGQGLAIVLLSDTLEETIALSHRVLVMRDGRSPPTSTPRPAPNPPRSISSSRWCSRCPQLRSPRGRSPPPRRPRSRPRRLPHGCPGG